jgi:hypothetical protein
MPRHKNNKINKQKKKPRNIGKKTKKKLQNPNSSSSDDGKGGGWTAEGTERRLRMDGSSSDRGNL